MIGSQTHAVLLNQNESGQEDTLKRNQHAQQRERIRIESPDTCVKSDPNTEPSDVDCHEWNAAHKIGDSIRHAVRYCPRSEGFLLELNNCVDIVCSRRWSGVLIYSFHKRQYDNWTVLCASLQWRFSALDTRRIRRGQALIKQKLRWRYERTRSQHGLTSTSACNPRCCVRSWRTCEPRSGERFRFCTRRHESAQHVMSCELSRC